MAKKSATQWYTYDELKLIENDFLTLFAGMPDELSEDMKEKLTKSTISNFFDYLRSRLETPKTP